MRRSLSLLAAVLLVASLPVVASAQLLADDDIVIVQVPFAFVAGDQELPAGTYRLEIAPGDDQTPGIVTLQTAAKSDKPDQMIFQSVSTKTVKVKDTKDTSVGFEEPRLVFAKVGDLHFLREVRVP